MKRIFNKLMGIVMMAALLTALCVPAFAFDEWDAAARNMDGITVIDPETVTYQDGVLTIANTRANPRGIQSLMIDGRDLTDAQGDMWSFGGGENDVTILFKSRLLDSLQGGTHTIRVDFLNHRLDTTFTSDGMGMYPVDEPDVDEPQSVANLQNPNTGGDNLNPDSPVFGLYMQAKSDFASTGSFVQSLLTAAGILLAAMLVWAIVPRKGDQRN